MDAVRRQWCPTAADAGVVYRVSLCDQPQVQGRARRDEQARPLKTFTVLAQGDTPEWWIASSASASVSVDFFAETMPHERQMIRLLIIRALVFDPLVQS